MQPEIIIIIAAVIALVVASIVTYKVTVSKLSKNADSKIGNAESRAREIIDEALKTAEATKKEALLEVKEESIKTKNELEKETKERNLAIERAEIIMKDLNKFSTPAGKARLQQAQIDVTKGAVYFYENSLDELRRAKALPKKTADEKEIRSDAIKNSRNKKRAAALINKYGAENIKAPDETVKEEIMNREANNFFDSIKIRKDLKAYLKSVSVYTQATKPYTDAKNLIEQAENYTHYDELEERYFQLCNVK